MREAIEKKTIRMTRAAEREEPLDAASRALERATGAARGGFIGSLPSGMTGTVGFSGGHGFALGRERHDPLLVASAADSSPVIRPSHMTRMRWLMRRISGSSE